MDDQSLDLSERIKNDLFAKAPSDGHCDSCEEDPIETVVICSECFFEVCKECYDKGPGCKCPGEQECLNCGLLFSPVGYSEACPACGVPTVDDESSL